MESIRGIAQDIQVKSVEKVNGQTTIKNYTTTGKDSSGIRNYKVKIDKTLVSFTKTKNSGDFNISNGDEVLVVGDKTNGGFISSAYYNISKNLIECISVKSLIIHFCMSLLFLIATLWSAYQIIFTNQPNTSYYILITFSTIFLLIFCVILLTGYKTRKFLLNEIKKL